MIPIRTLVVGGHTRNIGKSALVVDIIRAFPETAWTAVKLTQHGHGVCAINGASCDCAPLDHGFALDEEQDRSNRTDTSRFLVAGAARSLWVRTRQGCLGDFLPRLWQELQSASNVILESNSVLEFLRPELYLMVLDPAKVDFKDSARRFLDRADAFVLRAPLDGAPWLRADRGSPLISPQLMEGKPSFEQPLGGELPASLIGFLRQHFFTHSPLPAAHAPDISC
ncbi:MAG: hypothetical protein HY234_09705 [Acidobacteria bacterium]|nr:hypothetical protein [Acidobacteriota bacterium]MBI3663310.1 hypothetical protein [Acidobacteriota bacterium]